MYRPQGTARCDIIGQPRVFSKAVTSSSSVSDGDIKPVVLLGEALGLDEALLACPGETLHPQTDDVNKYWNARFEHEPKWAKHMLKEPEERTRELGKAEAQALEAAIRSDCAPFFDFVQASGQCAFKECLLRRGQLVNTPDRQEGKAGPHYHHPDHGLDRSHPQCPSSGTITCGCSPTWRSERAPATAW
jgi:hypothetical protein